MSLFFIAGLPTLTACPPGPPAGIRWSECSAPGVPHTAAALQQLFDFVTLRCQQTAARLSSGTAQSQRQDEGPQGSEWGGASQASAQGQGQRQGPVEVVPVLLAHNGAMFDLPVIRVECGRHGVEFPQDWWWVAGAGVRLGWYGAAELGSPVAHVDPDETSGVKGTFPTLARRLSSPYLLSPCAVPMAGPRPFRAA